MPLPLFRRKPLTGTLSQLCLATLLAWIAAPEAQAQGPDTSPPSQPAEATPPPAAPPGPTAPPAGDPPPQYQFAPPVYYHVPAGYHEHDGFFLRMTLGLGIGRSSTSLVGSDIVIRGGVGAFSLALGGAVAENLLLFGQIAFTAMPGPTIEVDGSEVATASEDDSLDTSGLGAGVAYYIMPLNAFVSGALLWTQLSARQDDDVVGETDGGPGADLRVGKEWWLSHDWGLGAYLGLQVSRMKDRNEGGASETPTWTNSAFTLGLSATYN